MAAHYHYPINADSPDCPTCKAESQYHGRLVNAPINRGKVYIALYQYTDAQGEWYLVNGLRVNADQIRPYLVKPVSPRIGFDL